MNWAHFSLLLAVIVIALAFTCVNGFHDTANAIATAIGTQVLTPGQAVALAAATNLVAAWLGSAVALTIATGLIDTGVLEPGRAYRLRVAADPAVRHARGMAAGGTVAPAVALSNGGMTA